MSLCLSVSLCLSLSLSLCLYLSCKRVAIYPRIESVLVLTRQTLDTFTAMGFDAGDVACLLRMLAAVLHIGDTEFAVGAQVGPIALSVICFEGDRLSCAVMC